MAERHLVTNCPQCRARVPVRLAPGEVCPTCRSSGAWEKYARPGERLVIDEEAISGAAERHALATAGPSPFTGMLALVPTAVGLLLGVFAVLAVVGLFGPRPLDTLKTIVGGFIAGGRSAALLGAGTTACGITALVLVRRSRHHRSWTRLLLSGGLVVAGVLSAIIGGYFWIAVSGFSWDHVEMPARAENMLVTDEVRAIMDATVVVLAPDEEGDARSLAIGTGAVVYSRPGRAWIVTCSHVAMPYEAVAAWRDAALAQAVLVYFPDGRHVLGTVEWTAQPPLDVAMVAVEIDDPPAAIVMARDTLDLSPGSEVMFVPNPFRSGWMAHTGAVKSIEPHITPAGKYSLLHSNLPVQVGDSGSGLYDTRGRLIGLNTWARTTRGGPVGISLPSEAMRAILDRIEEADPPEGREGR